MAWIFLALALPGCAARSIPPVGHGGQAFHPDPDEQALWAEAGREAAALTAAGLILDDPPLLDYLVTVASRLAGPLREAPGAPRVRVAIVKDPGPGAFSLPDGRVYLHTGLLARLEAEGELAAVLAHELAHVTRRHALVTARRAQARGATATVGAVDPARGHHGSPRALASSAATLLSLGLGLAHRAGVGGFDADLEREADEDALARLGSAGYDPRDALRLLERLDAEAASPSPGPAPPLGAGRPGVHDRLAAARAWLGAAAGPGPAAAAGATDFARRVSVAVRENALLELRRGGFAAARAQLGRVLALAPGDAVAHLYLGDLHRLEAQRAAPGADGAGLLARARDAYDRAARLDPDFADPWRQLGLLHFQARELAEARQAFVRYLALSPTAPDARRIREFIQELAD